jgi:hypothetical protein
VAVGKGDGVDGVNHGLPLPTAILCQLPGSRQSQAIGKFCFADCKKFQLAKGPLCRVSKKNSWQRKLQSAKSQFPVVIVFSEKLKNIQFHRRCLDLRSCSIRALGPLLLMGKIFLVFAYLETS